MADMNAVWLNLSRPAPLPIEITRTTTVDEFLGAQRMKQGRMSSRCQTANPYARPSTMTVQARGYRYVPPHNQRLGAFQGAYQQLHQYSQPTFQTTTLASKAKQGTSQSSTDQAALIADNPVFSIICDPSYVRITGKSDYVEKRLDTLSTLFPIQIEEISTEYHTATAELELQKLTAMLEVSPECYVRVSRYFNHRRQLLINRTEKKLDSLEKPSISKNQPKSKSDGVHVLRDWFKNHQQHPYPNLHEMKMLSQMSNIDIINIKIWFASERLRQNSAFIRKRENLF